MNSWKLLKVVSDGEPLKIGGINVWDGEWESLNQEEIKIPHPSYPSQTHTLWPYCIKHGNSKIKFAAGELSNCVWCFYVPG